jgi:two-component system cell cycle response regulator
VAGDMTRHSRPDRQTIDFSTMERDTEVAMAAERLRRTASLPQPVLIRVDGVEAGRVYALGSLTANAGRNPDNELVFDEPGISRFHATLFWDGQRHVLQDRNSRNGVSVQGRKVTEAPIADGEVIQFGPEVSLRYSIVDERQEDLLRRLYDSSTRDAMTGVYNRRHFDDRLAAEIAFALRHKTELSLTLLDVDFFKRVNDEHGHPAGDDVLKHLAATVQGQLRTEDIFARVGGEEFAILLRGIALEGTVRLAERLRRTVEATPASHQHKVLPITISQGCAVLAIVEDQTPRGLFAAADKCLYEAKRAGRNRVVA